MSTILNRGSRTILVGALFILYGALPFNWWVVAFVGVPLGLLAKSFGDWISRGER